MDTLAPQSVLDHRSNKKESLLVSDRITRHKSASNPSDQVSDSEEIDIRIPQPYRTSFSAVLTPARVSKERSRSTSPARVLTSSMKSEHGAVGRKVSPKHVTYDAKVTVRHSDSYDHETEVLQGDELNSSVDPAFDPSFTDYESPGGKMDYSSKIREMTELIVNEYSDKNGVDVTDSSQNSRKRVMGRQNAKNGLTNGGSPSPQKPMPPVHQLSKEYDHDRTVSYRQAITNQYSEEVKKLAEAKIEERYPPGARITHNSLVKDVKAERSNSVPSHPGLEDNNRLTPTKKSVGGSIGNFFRKLSPRLGRKSRKDKGSTSSVDTAGSQDMSLSRSKVRSSFLKLMGRSKTQSTTRSQDSLDYLSADREAGFVQEDKQNQMPTSSNRILKSIEQNTITERDVYQRFKEKQSPKSSSESSQLQGEVHRQSRPQAMRATAALSPPGTDKENLSQADAPSSSGEQSVAEPLTRVDPPSSLDIRVVAKSPRVLQSSMLSALSNEDSIGECSLDNTLTDSEASLLSRGGSSNSSKRPALGSRANTLGSESALSPTSLPGDHYSGKIRSTSDNAVLFTSMPKLASVADTEFKENTKTPSYLKLSGAVSGYGRYSQYSSYKSIEKRSPYSSCSSLQSDNKSNPDMPVTKVTSPLRKTSATNSNLELGLICPQPLVYDNGLISNGTSENGQIVLPEDHYPTGDRQQDGEYFLNITQQWADRLMTQCHQIEGYLQSPNISEDVRGKIRAAVGKANLLISQKFKQFRELCAEHMNPTEDGKVLKWADLQGFWEMIKIQADNIDDNFAELDLMRQNGWKELAAHSRGSSVNSSPKSGSISLSNGSTPNGTPGSRRKTTRSKDTPESSPERTEKMRAAAKAREEARKKLLADRRAAMKQKQKPDDVEIFIS